MMTPLAPPGINRRSQWHQEMLVELHEILLRLRDAPRLELCAPRDEFPPVGGEAVNPDGRNELTSEEIEIAEIEEALRRLRSGTYGSPDGVPGPVRQSGLNHGVGEIKSPLDGRARQVGVGPRVGDPLYSAVARRL